LLLLLLLHSASDPLFNPIVKPWENSTLIGYTTTNYSDASLDRVELLATKMLFWGFSMSAKLFVRQKLGEQVGYRVANFDD